MNISIEIIFAIVIVVLLIMSAREYWLKKIVTPAIKTRLRVSLIFCVVMIFNFLISK
ncbi:hypothetical protein EV695_1993 [Cocleimonas flava]|uniref:Uncharacterized protein n=1 Tax=Cocleimonas flava TaxID=634765 RepID=A0A4R1F0Z1_9GAMM|nr:hypothetical protein EV695_1993 [Cocleimonas flava]